MGEIIEEHLLKNDPQDGLMDTKDILYTIENKFESDLRRKLALVNVGKGKQNKQIVKTQNTDEPGNSPRIKRGKKQDQEHYKPVKKEFGDEGKKIYYQMRNSAVKRTVVNNRERLYIKVGKLPYPNFGDSEIATGNILISLIDGMGKEYFDEINLKDQYAKVEDRNAYKRLIVSNHSIKGVDLSKGEIYLDIQLNDSDSSIRNAKLRYYLEV